MYRTRPLYDRMELKKKDSTRVDSILTRFPFLFFYGPTAEPRGNTDTATVNSYSQTVTTNGKGKIYVLQNL